MVSRQDILYELVTVGLTVGTARSRLARATRQLEDEERINPQRTSHGKDHNKITYTDDDAAKIRAELGLLNVVKQQDTQTATEDTVTPAKVKHKDRPTTAEHEDTPMKSDDEATGMNGEYKKREDHPEQVDTSSQNQSTPSSQSIKALAKVEGPQKTEKKEGKPPLEEQATQKGKKLWTTFKPNWLFYAGGLLVLVLAGWWLVRKKTKSGGKKQAENEDLEAEGPATTPSNLAEQYEVW